MTTTPSTQHPTRRSLRGRRWRAAAAASVLVLAPLSVAACSSGSDDTASAASGNSGGAASNSDMQAFQECLAENGVEMGDPPSQGGSSDGSQRTMPDQDAMQQAQEACADLMPEGMGQGGPGAGAGGGGGEEMQAYTDCLAENGVEVQTPGAAGGQPPSGEPPAAGESGGPPSGSMFGLDTSDPEVAAAVEACADLEPSMPSGGPGQPGGADDGTDDSTSSESSTQSS